MRKNTKEELLQLATELEAKAEEILLDHKEQITPKVITYTPYMKDRKELARCRCHVCGHEWELQKDPATDNSILCPKCGYSDNAVAYREGVLQITEHGKPSCGYCFYWRDHYESTVVLFNYDQDTKRWYIVSWQPQWSFGDGEENEDPFAWMKNEIRIHADAPSHILIYDPEYGFLHMENESGNMTLLKKNVKKTKAFLDWLSTKTCYILLNDTGLGFKECIRRSLEVQEMNAELRKKNIVTLARQAETYSVKEYTPDAFIPYVHKVLTYVNTEIGAKSQINFLCTCGHKWSSGMMTDAEFRTECANVQCPKCGAPISEYGSLGTSWDEVQPFIVFENTDIQGNPLLVRAFMLTTRLHINEAKIQQSLHEVARVFVSRKTNGKAKKIVFAAPLYVSETKNELEKVSIDDLLSRSTEEVFFIQDPKEIVDVIRRSSMINSGLIEACGFDGPVLSGIEPFSYIATFCAAPQVELVAKANIPDILRSVCTGRKYDYEKLHAGATTQEVLGVSKTVLKTARKHHMNYTDMCSYNSLWKADETLTYELWKEIDAAGLNTRLILELKRKFNVPYKRTMEYLESVYKYQCVEKPDALSLWTDYLRMAARCNFDITDKSRKFPSSLKKEHDIAVFAFNKLKNEIDEKLFRTQAEKNAKILEFSYEDLFTVVPKTPQDIINEATAQKNCLRSYLEMVRDGSTRIAFLRRKEEPDRSYVTVEIDTEGRLVQVKGYCNSNPRSAAVDEFIKHWCKAKSLHYRGRY